MEVEVAEDAGEEGRRRRRRSLQLLISFLFRCPETDSRHRMRLKF